MNYSKTQWFDLPNRTTPVTAARLNNLESQHEQAMADVRVSIAAVDELAEWTSNRDAIQDANDALAAAGGGTIKVAPGAYEVKGVVLDSRVMLDLRGVTLISPDGTTPDVIRSRQTDTTATVAGATLTVASTAGIEPGAVCAVQYAGGILDSQVTTLTGAINASQTTGITLTTVSGLASAGVLQIGTELIQYTGISTATLTGVTRGASGSTAASHTTAETIGPARRHYANVVSIAGTTVTIDSPAILNVTGVQASFGAVGGGIVGRGVIDGNKVPGGAVASVYGVQLPLARAFTIDVQVRNTDQGGLMLSRGAADNIVQYAHLHNCGLPSVSKGSAFWLYQACKRNRIEQLFVTGEAWVSVYLDDRTTLNEEGWDGDNVDNFFGKVDIDVMTGAVAAIQVVSGHRNHFAGGRIRCRDSGGAVIGLGLAVSNGGQGTGSSDSANNYLGGFNIEALQGWNITSTQRNILAESFVTANTNTVGSVASGNLAYGNSSTPGGVPSIPLVGASTGSGTPPFSFTGDSDTGLYSDSPNVVGLAAGATAALRAFSTEARFYPATKQTLVHSSGYVELTEMAAGASAPAADKARLYVEDNGSGKTRLMARFASGAAVQIAIEP